MSVFKNADFMHLCIYKLEHPCALGHWLLGHLGCPWVKGGGGGGGGEWLYQENASSNGIKSGFSNSIKLNLAMFFL